MKKEVYSRLNSSACLKLFLIFAIITIINNGLFSQNSQAMNQDYLMETIHTKSQIQNRSLDFVTYKPKNLGTNDSITILYVLDGELSIQRFQKLKQTFQNYDTKFIIVGVVNPDNKLFSSTHDKYLSWLTKEVIPVAEKDLPRIRRYIFGHDLSGAFVIYALINNPLIFQYYIAVSPYPIADLCKKENFEKTDNKLTVETRLYVGSSSLDSKEKRNDFDNISACFKAFQPKSLITRLETYEKSNYFDR
jgi:predicted alpha/beta superfamily hydrolase